MLFRSTNIDCPRLIAVADGVIVAGEGVNWTYNSQAITTAAATIMTMSTFLRTLSMGGMKDLNPRMRDLKLLE